MALVVLGDQLVGELDVLSLSVLLRGARQVLPRLPLVLTLEIKRAWFRGGVVTNGGLLVQTVQLQQLVVGRTLGQVGHGVGLVVSIHGSDQKVDQVEQVLEQTLHRHLHLEVGPEADAKPTRLVSLTQCDLTYLLGEFSGNHFLVRSKRHATRTPMLGWPREARVWACWEGPLLCHTAVLEGRQACVAAWAIGSTCPGHVRWIPGFTSDVVTGVRHAGEADERWHRKNCRSFHAQ